MKIKPIHSLQWWIIVIVCSLPYYSLQAQEVIENGKYVSLELVMKIAGEPEPEKKENTEIEPVSYFQGNQEMPLALEQALAGLKANDTKTVTLTPEQAYGPVSNDAFIEFPIDAIPEQDRKVGTKLLIPDPTGLRRYIRVHEVHEDKIILDFNHPLAGKTLIFDVRVLSIE